MLHLDVSIATVYRAIQRLSKIRAMISNIYSHPDLNGISIEPKLPTGTSRSSRSAGLYFVLQKLKRALLNVVVEGITTVQRAVVNVTEGSDVRSLLRESVWIVAS